MTVPARAVLHRADAACAAGDEKDGFLSEAAGLLPRDPPLTRLPDTHAAWDEVAARLPELYRTLSARTVLDAMPVLEAGEDDLPDRYVWRGCALLGMFAHSYVRVLPERPERLPDSIEVPWSRLCRRLGRTQTALTYDDLIAYNWRLRDPTRADRRRLEDLDLLTPTVGNREERVFYLAQVEILTEGAPIVGAMVRAQEAAEEGDDDRLERELVAIIDIVDRVSTGSFSKIDANPYSPTFVDPVVWAKTVAPFAVAIREDSHSISGAAAPLFQALDAFIGRTSFDTRVGRESRRLRPAFSPHFRSFLDALEAVSVSDHVRSSDSSNVKGLWRMLLESYVGDTGFLAVHRRKAFAFLELAFKVGRSVTTGGFTGLFEDQTWEVAHTELEASRLERLADVCEWAPVVRPATTPRGRLTAPGLVHVELDVSEAGVRHRPGDRLAVVPQNAPGLVQRTLDSLRAAGEEPVRLDNRWTEALRGWSLAVPADGLPLRDLLTRGRIRPVSRDTAKALAAASESQPISRIVNGRQEHTWELWDLLRLVSDGGFDTRRLWRADPWEPYSICKLVPPEGPRLYSISSASDNECSTVPRVELLLSEVRYTTPGNPIAGDLTRRGTASSFLLRASEGAPHGVEIPIRVVPSARFRMPEDQTVPIVMFAGGAGLSPFLSFIGSRAQHPAPGDAWLFLSTRSDSHVALYREELTVHIEAGWLRFLPVVTGGEEARSERSGLPGLVAEHAPELLNMMRAKDEGGREATLYVCGAAGFSASVIDGLERAVAPLLDDPTQSARTLVRKLIGGRRLQQDVFTAHRGSAEPLPLLDASAVAVHNDDDHGYWTVIDGGVYDVTELAHRHPGGRAIVLEHAGRDATRAFNTIEHNIDPEIQAMLGMYQIGQIRRLDFGSAWTVGVSRSGLSFSLLGEAFRKWVKMLYRVVEVENAVRHDFGLLDEVTVGGDLPAEMTFFKAQLLLEAHQRFLSTYLPSLFGPGLDDLWGTTAGLCAPAESFRRLQESIEAVRRGRAAATARDELAQAWPWLYSLGTTDPATREQGLDHLSDLRILLERADRAFLVSMKEAIRSGVAAFERWERDVGDKAAETLVEALVSVPDLTDKLYEDLAGMVERTAAQRRSHGG